jgi:hypothetical protein
MVPMMSAQPMIQAINSPKKQHKVSTLKLAPLKQIQRKSCKLQARAVK